MTAVKGLILPSFLTVGLGLGTVAALAAALGISVATEGVEGVELVELVEVLAMIPD